MKYFKIDLSKEEFGSLYLSAYEVWHERKKIGIVWSREGFSYFGTGGWNSGIRYRDYHPTEWFSGQKLTSSDAFRHGPFMRRSWAAQKLLDKLAT